uniref:Uncharacterized protein n=1 Tax=Timema genevievae TaxID=629358 RepID=A0A7R9JVM3_TIMGE|nr:unnamed protein product [Timema genevievae]
MVRLVNPRTTSHSRLAIQQVVGTARLVTLRTTCSQIYKPRAVRDLPYNRSWARLGSSIYEPHARGATNHEPFATCHTTGHGNSAADIPDEYRDALEVFSEPLISRTSIETHWKCSRSRAPRCLVGNCTCPLPWVAAGGRLKAARSLSVGINLRTIDRDQIGHWSVRRPSIQVLISSRYHQGWWARDLKYQAHLDWFAAGGDVGCWENCELLQSNFPVWGAMCSNKGICWPNGLTLSITLVLDWLITGRSRLESWPGLLKLVLLGFQLSFHENADANTMTLLLVTANPTAANPTSRKSHEAEYRYALQMA